MTDQRCENCRFWLLWDVKEKQFISRAEFCEKGGIPNHDSDLMKRLIPNEISNADRRGSCRRFPPLFRSEDEEDEFDFPNTTWDDWCGEWQANESLPRKTAANMTPADFVREVMNTPFDPWITVKGSPETAKDISGEWQEKQEGKEEHGIATNP